MRTDSNIKVALIVPKTELHLSSHGPPMNLAFIASYLRKYVPNVQVKIFDGSIGDDLDQCISTFQPHIIGVTATTPQALSAYRLGDEINGKWPDIFTVIGGIHASIRPLEASKHFHVVVVGEGEKTFSQIVEQFKNNQPPKGIVQGDPVDNLDDIPSPAFDLLKMKQYLRIGIDLPTLKPPVMGLVTSRGCPYRCAFCYNSKRRTKIRYFSAKRIVEDILFLRKMYRVNQIYFFDDEFLINQSRMKELSSLFKEYGISNWLKWACNARATTVTVPLLKMAKEMGCTMVLFGLESGNERILQYLKAGSSTLSTNQKGLNIAEQAGLPSGGSFIFGTPTESLEEMKQSFNWIVDNPKLTYIGISILSPYPGTAVWDLCVEKGLISEDINYQKLIQDASPKVNTVYVASIPYKTFVRFMLNVNDATWFMNQIRSNPTFKNFMFTVVLPTSWKVLANKPRVIIKEFENVVTHSINKRN
jgi:anaerobic magnesium-protoporphyrin IX monomethyl ester cyclase